MKKLLHVGIVLLFSLLFLFAKKDAKADFICPPDCSWNYAYGQSWYYGYGQSSYWGYGYGQSSYYGYGQGSYGSCRAEGDACTSGGQCCSGSCISQTCWPSWSYTYGQAYYYGQASYYAYGQASYYSYVYGQSTYSDSCDGACATNISCVAGATKSVSCATQGSCGTGGCGPGEQLCTVSCTRTSPSGCLANECNTYCAADPSCGQSCGAVIPVDGGCGEGGCSPVKRLIGTRICTNPDTEAPVCADDPACGAYTYGQASYSPYTYGEASYYSYSQSSYSTNGTVRARAVGVDPSDTTCATINASANYLNGTQFLITGQSIRTQAGGAYVSWSPVPAGSYTLTATFPGDWGLARGCWSRTVTSPTSGTGMGASFSVNGETLTWNVGAVPPGAWVQTRGGDVYAATNIQSLLPSTSLPTRHFSLVGTGGYPGVVRYGTGFDFEIGAGDGSAYVSPTNWLANTIDRYQVDYYDIMWRKLGGPTTPDFDANDLASPLVQPASREAAYYAVGDVTTSGNWVVPAGESLIMLIDGNLTLDGTVTTTGTGFVAFIVKGNITVDPTVGTTFSSTTPVLEGVYITSPTGTFSTGASSVPGAERFVGQGVFVAGAFELLRDLASVGQNDSYAAEYFIYDPAILLTMPEEMMESAVTWSEIAP